MTNSIRNKFSKIRNDYFNTTKLIQLKIENNLWRAQLDELFSKNVAEDILQYCQLQEGDVVLLAIGQQIDAVSIKSLIFSFLVIIKCIIISFNYNKCIN